MITFLTYYQELTPSTKKKVLQLAKKFCDYHPLTLIDLMFKSARKFHPGCRTVLLTNNHSQFTLDPSIEIVRCDVDDYKIIMAKIMAGIHYLNKMSPPSNVVFLDWDILFQENIDHVFARPVDLSLTLRTDFADQPVNMGILFFAQHGLPGAIKFMSLIINGMLQLGDYRYWWGDQTVVWNMLKPLFEQNKVKEGILEYEGIKIGLLKAEEYNYSGEMKEKVPFAKILHFKSLLKPEMIAYWKNYLENYRP